MNTLTFTEFIEKEGYKADNYLTFSATVCAYVQERYKKYLEQ